MNSISLTGFAIFKAGFYAAIGWFVGKAVYGLAVELIIKGFDRLAH